jgi:hypothetical protein
MPCDVEERYLRSKVAVGAQPRYRVAGYRGAGNRREARRSSPIPVFFDKVLGEYDLARGYSASGNPVPRVERDLVAAVVIGSAKVRAARRQPAW